MNSESLRIGIHADASVPVMDFGYCTDALAAKVDWVSFAPEQAAEVAYLDGFIQTLPALDSLTHAVQKHFPLIPVADQQQLSDPQLFDNFMLRVQATQNFRTQVLAKPSKAALTNFHARYKYLLMAHHPDLTRYMGLFLASAHQPLEQHCQAYQQMLMQALVQHATRKNHTNALQHMLGYLRKSVNQQARQLVAKSIDDFYHGKKPLLVPLSLLHHYALQLEKDYLRQQQYFTPYPSNLHPTRFLGCL